MSEAEAATRYSYLSDPDRILERSFSTIRDEVDLRRFPKDLHPLVIRLIHSCGMTDIVDDLVLEGDLLGAARNASHIYVDATMVQNGIKLFRQEVTLHCTLQDPSVEPLSMQLGTTRSAAAVELWRPYLDRAIVAIGNAPTALFHLLESLDQWRMEPLAILAFPVGFVGAEESKEALINASLGVPFVTLRGRRGGSALAAAAVNALMQSRAQNSP